ncbi:MAG: ribonuclease HI family protein [Pseudomonadota bacterium]
MAAAADTAAGTTGAGAWTVHCDGSAVPNPGRMGLGAVLVAPDGTRHTLSVATHRVGCNNEAELRALMAALEAARAHGATAVEVHTDNSILVAQLGGANAAAAAVRPIARLAPLFDAARGLLGGFAQARLQWIPGHRNGEADALARAALDLPPRMPAKASKKKRRR